MLLGAEGRLKIYLQNKAQVFQLKDEILIALQISNTFNTSEQIYFFYFDLEYFHNSYTAT